jgi:spore maturation protein SpmA
MKLSAYQIAELWGRIEMVAASLREAVTRHDFSTVREAHTTLGELIAQMDANAASRRLMS